MASKTTFSYKGKVYKVYYWNGYPYICPTRRTKKRLHHLVWEIHHGERPKGYHIHHKDHNTKNYNIENLELVTPGDHSRIHAGWLRSNGEWTHKPCNSCERVLPLDCFYKKKAFKDTSMGYISECKVCRNAYVVSYTKESKGRKEYQRLYSSNYRKSMTDQQKERVKILRKEYEKIYRKSEKRKEYVREYGKSDKRREYMRKYRKGNKLSVKKD